MEHSLDAATIASTNPSTTNTRIASMMQFLVSSTTTTTTTTTTADAAAAIRIVEERLKETSSMDFSTLAIDVEYNVEMYWATIATAVFDFSGS